VITWSGPEIAMSGLLFSLQPSHDFSFLQEIQIPPHYDRWYQVRKEYSFHKNSLAWLP
jgi:hypothetical protein